MKLLKLYFFSIMFTVGFGSFVTAAEWKNPDEAGPEVKAEQAPPGVAGNPARIMDGEPGLDVQRVCDLEQTYDDRGSGGEQDVKFYLPVTPPGYSLLGGYAQGNHYRPDACVLTVRPANNESNALLQPPRDWQRIWTDRNSGARKDGSIWHAVPGSADYICLGSVAVQGYNKPVLSNYACLHQCLVEEVPVMNYIWSDRGTGAGSDVSVYRLHNSNGFYAVPAYNKPVTLRDIRQRPACRF